VFLATCFKYFSRGLSKPFPDIASYLLHVTESVQIS